MIRKIFLGAFCIYLAVWLVVAYAIKSELRDWTAAHEGLNFTYKAIKISGFPSKWIFEFDHPVIQSEDNYVTLRLNAVLLIVNISFTEFILESSKNITLTLAEEEGSLAYDASFTSNPRVIFNRKNRFFSKNRLYGFSSLTVPENILEVLGEEKEILKIDNKHISIVRNIDERFNSFVIDCDLVYEGGDDLFSFSKLRLGVLNEVVFGQDNKEKKIFLTSFSSKRFDIVVDEEAELHLSGQLTFALDALPTGEFTLDLVGAEKLVDALWWSSFNLSAEDVKNMILKASGNQSSDNVSLPVVFSTDGLTVGSSSWQELKQGN